MRATRIAPADSPGSSLFKAPRAVKPRRTIGRNPRQSDAEHLEAIRQCPCLRCGQDPCGEAAHVRMGSHAGMGRKPDDSATVPLCHGCHMDQHAVGELSFWDVVGIAPLTVAASLWRLSANIEAMRAACFVAIGFARNGREQE